MNIGDVIQFIRSDQGLSESQKSEMLDEDGKKRIASLLSGTSGAALGLALAKYKHMSKTSQLLLSALGFGAGVLLYKYYTREKTLNYDSKTEAYQIN